MPSSTRLNFQMSFMAIALSRLGLRLLVVARPVAFGMQRPVPFRNAGTRCGGRAAKRGIGQTGRETARERAPAAACEERLGFRERHLAPGGERGWLPLEAA